VISRKTMGAIGARHRQSARIGFSMDVEEGRLSKCGWLIARELSSPLVEGRERAPDGAAELCDGE
jgi:hypothetical protein